MSAPAAAKKGNNTARPYTAPTPERRLEKKLAASERKQSLLTEEEVPKLLVKCNEGIYGKGAMVLHMGQNGENAAQLILHRTLGSVPTAQMSSWYLTPKGVAKNLVGMENPYTEKTQQSVSILKQQAGLRANSVKILTATGKLVFPSGVAREDFLEECRKLADIHKKVEGGKPLIPTFAYGAPAQQAEEIAYLNALATDKKLQEDIVEKTRLYNDWEAVDPQTGVKQVPIQWAEGIPASQIDIVLMDVIRKGAYSPDWDMVKEKTVKKVAPFASWGYIPGHYPVTQHKQLIEALNEFAKARRDYMEVKEGTNLSDEQKAQKKALHEAYQQANKRVNEVERFDYQPHTSYDPVAPEGDKMSKVKREATMRLPVKISE